MMTDNENGGGAFPCEGTGGLYPDPGMTLRDYFAGQALAGDSANSSFGFFESDIDQNFLVLRAEYYYRYADAMLEARK